MSVANFILILLLAPLLSGLINRVKAKFAGRKGKPVLQLYRDMFRLIHKGPVYSTTTTWVFRAGPLVGLASVMAALCFVPLGGDNSLIGFNGDFFLAAYLLAMGRFATILAAMDTSSAFEGMGASREATFSALAEPVFILAFIPLGMTVQHFSLSAMLAPFSTLSISLYWTGMLLPAAALFLVLLVENSRIPVDDPNTHLELTMIHEAMILDHSGPDLAMIEYAAALKLWFFSAVISGILLPGTDTLAMLPFLRDIGAETLAMWPWPLILSLIGIFVIALLVGVTESVMARLRLMRVQQLLSLAIVLAALACLVTLA
jgi:formate hydrogenlyase subunit 4